MIFLLSYRNIGEIFTNDRYTHSNYFRDGNLVCLFREVIDVTSKITYLGAIFVYSDSIQVRVITFCAFY